MELNFDKEIDALLRQAAKSESLAGANGSISHAHIDADALSAFAENALPEKTRALYMTHLGDCDRCRKILSNLIALNSEPWPPATSTIETPEIAIAPIPWYRKLFIFPNLAYTMGALVLVFSGLLGFLLVRNMGNGATTISQVANKEPARPAAIPEPPVVATNANSAFAPSANSSANASATPPVNLGMNFDSNTTKGEPGYRENNFTVSELDKVAEQPATSGPPAANADTTRGDDDVIRQPKEQNPQPVESRDEKKNEDTLSAARPAPPPPPPAKSAPTGGLMAKDAEAARAKSDAPANASRKQLAGKSFNRRDGVWYDSTYSTQPVTSVRRGTDEYRKLDPGVRSIGDSLSGTVVVVWKEKAYRIQ